MYLDEVISLGVTFTEALGRLEEVLSRLSNFGLQLKAKKCTFMQAKVVFLGHIVGRTGLACDPAKLAAVQNWHCKEIPVSSEGSHWPCGSGPTLGESSYGLIGHVNHVGEGESLCTCDGGLFLSVDGGLSVAGQNRHFGGGCFL